ncbi:hypothetical protein [Crocosphaera sp. XPORK-15E]|uniref:hypothetical protein n=1 Tax=Crocosphaera sp. XPORK-15E TaxID=3110247 RepID=UPI002B20A52C|nr:hypothetical protein [Crocosphaera sp. XPORK-15E]MEA5536791.1 hypothetical protein [Crocosphaera sp. XPORK-15E]
MSISILRQLLQQYSVLVNKSGKNAQYKYKTFYELVLEIGQEMKPTTTPKELMGQPKNCYYNCQLIAFEHPDLTYCEGFTLSNNMPFPLAHAWLLDHSGMVIEPTWEEPAQAYIGIPFSIAFVKSILKEREDKKRSNYLSLFECNHLEGYSFLKEGLPSEAYYVLEKG